MLCSDGCHVPSLLGMNCGKTLGKKSRPDFAFTSHPARKELACFLNRSLFFEQPPTLIWNPCCTAHACPGKAMPWYPATDLVQKLSQRIIRKWGDQRNAKRWYIMVYPYSWVCHKWSFSTIYCNMINQWIEIYFRTNPSLSKFGTRWKQCRFDVGILGCTGNWLFVSSLFFPWFSSIFTNVPQYLIWQAFTDFLLNFWIRASMEQMDKLRPCQQKITRLLELTGIPPVRSLNPTGFLLQ